MIYRLRGGITHSFFMYRRPRRVVYEEDLDRELEEEAGMEESDESEEEEEEEEEWQKPSAYSRLVGSLQKTSKHRDFYERIKREQQGVEDIEEELEDEGEEDIEGEDEDDDEGKYTCLVAFVVTMCSKDLIVRYG